MPNLHWFGTESDHALVLSDIFALEEVQVFELYSEPGKCIRTFSDADDVLSLFQAPNDDGSPRTVIHLNLWVYGSGPKPVVERVALNPKKCGGHSWRERSGVVGFVTFYLERLAGGRLMHSQTNTVSEARMGAIDGHYTGHDGVIWDIRRTNRFSSKLNRLIRKRSFAKISSCPILPGAAQLWESGISFGYHWSKANTPDLYKASKADA